VGETVSIANTGLALQHLAERYDHHTVFPERAREPFIVGIIGNVGSGKSTLARELREYLEGSVVVSANSVRYLLRGAKMPWGENVRQLVWELTLRYALRNLTVIVDGGTTERGARDQLFRIADAHGIPIWFVQLSTSTEVCRQRTYAKYINPDWVDNFAEPRIGHVAEQMLSNVVARASTHEQMRTESIEGLLEVVGNEGDVGALRTRARILVDLLSLARRSWRPKGL